MADRTVAIGPTIIAVSRCSAGRRRHWPRGPTRRGGRDIVQSHDWHAGLAPAYLKAEAAAEGKEVAASICTVHNLAYQGWFAAGIFPELSLPADFYQVEGVEFYGGVSFLKAGLAYADRLTTVSPTYAAEIQTPRYGANFDGVLRLRADVLTGILNGVDPRYWDPEHDDAIPLPYGVDTAEAGKAAAKAELRRRLQLADGAAPVFGVVSRLTPQKGLDLLLAALPDLTDGGGQLALLGAGDRDLETGFTEAAAAQRGAGRRRRCAMTRRWRG